MLAKSANAINKKDEAILYVGEILDKAQGGDEKIRRGERNK